MLIAIIALPIPLASYGQWIWVHHIFSFKGTMDLLTFGGIFVQLHSLY